jgi:signal transduction histidine kinase
LIIAANQVFRITYEAFSKYSNRLLRCRSFKDIEECFRINLKYLFNFHVFRASYQRNGLFIHLEATASATYITVEREPRYLNYEKKLLETSIPMRWIELESMALPASFCLPLEEEGTLWGWHIKNDDRQIVVSVLSGLSKSFSKADIAFVKLVAENLESKLLEVCLFEEVDEKNKKLEEAVHTINEKNAIITDIIEEQKEVIKERTKEIEAKNKTLLEISVLNAHNVREPLSRILGLVSLVDYERDEEVISDIISKIKTSSNDLDLALQQIISRATIDLLKHKA